MASSDPNIAYPQGEPSPLVVRESGGDEVLFFLCQAREAIIDEMAARTMIDDVQVDYIKPEVRVQYALILGSINLRKRVLGIDSLQE